MASNNVFLSNLTYDGDSGKVAFGQTRYLVIRPEVLTDLQKALEAEVGMVRAAEIVAQQSFNGGLRIVGNMPSVATSLSPLEKLKLACHGLSEVGWGRFDLGEVDLDNGKFQVDVWNSAFAADYGAADAPVCHVIRGLLSGLATNLLGEGATAVESHCVSCGDDHCSFTVKAG